MTHLRFNHRSALLLAGLALSLLFATAGVAHASFGEIKRFGAPGLNGSQEGEVGKLTPSIRDPKVPTAFDFRPWHVLGVEPETNDVYVLEEYKISTENTKEELTRYLRLQEFTAEGEPLAHTDFTFNSAPSENTESEESIEGIAVDPKAGRLYFLITEQREQAPGAHSLPEEEENVAAALYSFKATPSGKVLEPAPGTTGGLLDGPEQLDPTSETPGVPLLQPQGITVDEHTHEVVILAHTDSCVEVKHEELCAEDELSFEPGKDHYVTQRVKEDGELGERFADPGQVLKTQSGEEYLAPESPVVTGSGTSEHLLANDFVDPEAGSFQLQDFLDEFPATASGTPTRTALPSPGGAETNFEKLAEEGEDIGGTLAVSPDGKTLYGVTTIQNEEAGGSPKGLFGISVRSAETLQPIGWTGGQQSDTNDKCVLQPGINEGERIQIAAGKEDKIFALVPEYLREPAEGHFPTKDAIIEFGEGGEGCPQASSAKVSIVESGKELEPPLAVGANVSLTSFIKQGDALSVKWKIENEATKAVVTEEQSTDQLEHPTLKHEFNTAGSFKITEEVKTDNLETPTLTVTRAGVKVEETGEPVKISKQPESTEVPSGTTAKFTAAAGGKPTPSPSWRVSHNKGVSFEADKEDKGEFSNTLEVSATKLKSGDEYEVTYSNGVEEATSNAATLTVTTVAPKITAQPSSTSVTAGATATFTAAATGNPAPTVQWEFSTEGGATGSWEPLIGKVSPTLTIEATTLPESGFEYRANFSNEGGSQLSSVATLTVTAPLITPPAPPPSLGPGPSTGPSTQVLPSKEASPTAVIAGSSSVMVTAAGVLTIKVSCPPGSATCAGTVTLRTLQAVIARAITAKAKKAILTLASGSFSVAGGSSKTLTLHLSSAGRKLLTKSHAVAARATVLAHNPEGQRQTTLKTLTLRLAKPKH